MIQSVQIEFVKEDAMNKDMNKDNKAKDNKVIVRLVVIALIAFVGLTSCAQSTRESKLEDAKIAIDNRDFSKAILLTEELLDKNGDGKFDKVQDTLTVDDVEAAHLSASARFGRAGIDLTAMLILAEQNGATKANEKTSPCITDTNFRTISNMLPAILTSENLTDLELGLDIVDNIILNKLVINSNQLKQENLLKAIGNAARIVVAIIVETDTNGDNIPDTIPPDATLNDLAKKLFDSFIGTLEGLANSGIVSSDLSKAIVALRTNITKNPDDINITGTNLSVYLQGIVNLCK
jgi:hypothetical protein